MNAATIGVSADMDAEEVMGTDMIETNNIYGAPQLLVEGLFCVIIPPVILIAKDVLAD
jgi:hypothetical protein